MKHILLVAFAVTLFCASCKKKDESPAPTPTNTTTTGNNSFAYSDMYTGYSILNYNNSITVDSSASAQFYLESNPNGPAVNVTAGNVNLNSYSLTAQSDNVYMSPNPGPLSITGPLNWTVAGSGTITAFNYSYTASYPKYTGGNLLQDTCVKANGISINVAGLSDYVTEASNSGLTVMLLQNTMISKPIFGTAGGTVTFSAAELSGFSSNSPISIMISVVNFNRVVVNGVNRNFNCGLLYQKYSYLK